ncbi:hypothetical protein EBR78_07970 [bacterium]|nr:hypothetical protein [bacterium]
MVFSPAKLNLGLRIVGRRPDGYHLLQSLFWPLTFVDTLQVESAQQVQVQYLWAADAPIPHPVLLQNSETLLGKMLETLVSEKKIPPLQVSIQKRIPIGGGLGGVSSNCGAVLKYCMDQKWLSSAEAHQVACRFGADIPFFISATPSWVTGIGEKISPLTLQFQPGQKLFFLLLLFPFQIPTPLIFKKYRDAQIGMRSESDWDPLRNQDWNSFLNYLENCQNDLEAIVVKERSEIQKALNSLRLTDCITSQISGTGATCYGIYASEEKRLKAAQEIETICRDLNCRKLFTETFTSCAVQL